MWLRRVGRRSSALLPSQVGKAGTGGEQTGRGRWKGRLTAKADRAGCGRRRSWGRDPLWRMEDTRQSPCLLEGLGRAAGRAGGGLSGEFRPAHIPPSRLHLPRRFPHIGLQLRARLPPVRGSVPPPGPCPPLAARAPHPSWHSSLEDLPTEPQAQAPRVEHPPGRAPDDSPGLARPHSAL